MGCFLAGGRGRSFGMARISGIAKQFLANNLGHPERPAPTIGVHSDPAEASYALEDLFSPIVSPLPRAGRTYLFQITTFITNAPQYLIPISQYLIPNTFSPLFIWIGKSSPSCWEPPYWYSSGSWTTSSRFRQPSRCWPSSWPPGP